MPIQMPPVRIPWFSTTKTLATEEHEPVTLEEAVRIADGYFARAGERFEAGEDALAATMFSFGSDRGLIELCVHGTDHISCSYQFEAPDGSVHWLLKPFKRVFQHEERLRSRDEMIHRIEEFFSSPPAEIISRCKGRA